MAQDLKEFVGERLFWDDPPADIVSCWLTATSLAEWCDALDESTATFLSSLSSAWRVKIPNDLTDLDKIPGLRYAITWRFLEEDYKIFSKNSYKRGRLLDLSIALRMDGILIEEETMSRVCDNIREDCEKAAEAIYKWCSTPDEPLPNTFDYRRLLKFRETWTALERDHKVFRFTNNKARYLMRILILNRMQGLL